MKSLQSAVHALSFDPTLARLLATTPRQAVEQLAQWLAAEDPYNEGRAISRALQLVPADPYPDAHIAHQVWCAWRQAAWTSCVAQPLTVQAEGLTHLAETEGQPTLLVAPMTLSPGDAMDVIAQLNVSGRPCVVFGEDLDTANGRLSDRLEIVSGMSGATVRRILEVLNEGGILCTYPDFVYERRAAETIRLFGTDRPVSSGFISLASRNGTMLLPLVCTREHEAIIVHVHEPVRVENPGPSDSFGRTRARAVVGQTVSDLLEELIRRAPEQWLLLPTLTFEAPEMASTEARALQPSADS